MGKNRRERRNIFSQNWVTSFVYFSATLLFRIEKNYIYLEVQIRRVEPMIYTTIPQVMYWFATCRIKEMGEAQS